MSKCFVIIGYLDRRINLAYMGLTALACFNNKGKMIKDVLIAITIVEYKCCHVAVNRTCFTHFISWILRYICVLYLHTEVVHWSILNVSSVHLNFTILTFYLLQPLWSRHPSNGYQGSPKLVWNRIEISLLTKCMQINPFRW